MIACIDTNAVLGMFGRAAPLLELRRALLAGKFRWALSNEILLEYEEIALREMGTAGVDRMLRFIELADEARGAILRISPNFRFHLIRADADDDKFADCAIAAEADFIITADSDFNVMRGSGYKPQPITPEEFIRLHLSGA
jgi:putative PIN family toxin of toxin-antitoxin system